MSRVWLAAAVAAILAVGAFAQSGIRARDGDAALKKATVGGKCRMLLAQIRVPEDAATYGEFNDYGYYPATSYAGHADLPAGYWVYVAPTWYIWAQESAHRGEPRPWGPEQATGPPDTQQYGDIQTAWASQLPGTREEWLMLEYAEPVSPTQIHIYETYNPGAVVRVTGFRLDGAEVELWRGKDPTQSQEKIGVLSIPLRAQFPTNRIKVYLGVLPGSSWHEIDAVGIDSADGRTLWARTAVASSFYGEDQGAGPEIRATIDRLSAQIDSMRAEIDRLRALIDSRNHQLPPLTPLDQSTIFWNLGDSVRRNR